MKFLIQTIEGEIKYDFSFSLIQSINYQKWLKRDDIDFLFTDKKLYPDYIPIGSVEFVINYLNKHYNLIPKPKNIPKELLDYKWTNRYVFNGTDKDITDKKFIKSNDSIKGFTEISKNAPPGNYQISDIIDIKSEWRCFIYKGKLVGLQNYSGEFDTFPNVNKIKSIIKNYKSQPVAFTLDVGITEKNETSIIEVHDFFSVGLYGFSNYNILPFMFSRWFYSFLKKNKRI